MFSCLPGTRLFNHRYFLLLMCKVAPLPFVGSITMKKNRQTCICYFIDCSVKFIVYSHDIANNLSLTSR